MPADVTDVNHPAHRVQRIGQEIGAVAAAVDLGEGAIVVQIGETAIIDQLRIGRLAIPEVVAACAIDRRADTHIKGVVAVADVVAGHGCRHEAVRPIPSIDVCSGGGQVTIGVVGEIDGAVGEQLTGVVVGVVGGDTVEGTIKVNG